MLQQKKNKQSEIKISLIDYVYKKIIYKMNK